jgi:hypothetical protein
MMPDFGDYHENVLPELISDGRGALAAKEAARLGVFAFRMRETGESYTY